MLREDGLRQKAELLVPLARIDERCAEGDADELQARADAEERGRCFTNERKLVGKGLAQTLAIPVGEAAGEKDGIRRRVERPELCIVCLLYTSPCRCAAAYRADSPSSPSGGR